MTTISLPVTLRDLCKTNGLLGENNYGNNSYSPGTSWTLATPSKMTEPEPKPNLVPQVSLQDLCEANGFSKQNNSGNSFSPGTSWTTQFCPLQNGPQKGTIHDSSDITRTTFQITEPKVNSLPQITQKLPMSAATNFFYRGEAGIVCMIAKLLTLKEFACFHRAMLHDKHWRARWSTIRQMLRHNWTDIPSYNALTWVVGQQINMLNVSIRKMLSDFHSFGALIERLCIDGNVRAIHFLIERNSDTDLSAIPLHVVQLISESYSNKTSSSGISFDGCTINESSIKQNTSSIQTGVFTTLGHFCSENEVKVVAYLVNAYKSLDVNKSFQKDGEITNALYEAAKNGYTDVVKTLLSHKSIEVNWNNTKNETALHAACVASHLEIVQLLCEAGACFDPKSLMKSPFHAAARKKNGAIIVKYFLDNTKVHVDLEEENEGTALQCAIENGSLGVVKLLCEYGADLNKPHGIRQWNPLHYATEYNCIEIVKVLCQYKANVNCVTDRLWTPLHWAACYGKIDIMEVLCQHGANRNAKNVRNETPLQSARRMKGGKNKKYSKIKAILDTDSAE